MALLLEVFFALDGTPIQFALIVVPAPAHEGSTASTSETSLT